jgi:hypothetical protein
VLGSNWYPLRNGFETLDCRATTPPPRLHVVAAEVTARLALGTISPPIRLFPARARQQLVPAAKWVRDAGLPSYYPAAMTSCHGGGSYGEASSRHNLYQYAYSQRVLGSNWYPLRNGFETRDCRATTPQLRLHVMAAKVTARLALGTISPPIRLFPARARQQLVPAAKWVRVAGLPSYRRLGRDVSAAVVFWTLDCRATCDFAC